MENLNLDRYLPEPDADDHYPTCPVFAPEAEDSVCDCDEETQKIRADFAEARYDLGRDA